MGRVAILFASLTFACSGAGSSPLTGAEPSVPASDGGMAPAASSTGDSNAPPPTPRADGGIADAGSDAPEIGELPTCTKGRGQNPAGPTMVPGIACKNCHQHDGFVVAGTVFPAPHEDDDCTGSPGMTVVLTDANGQNHALTATSNGNFYLSGNLAFPLKVKITSAGKERAMTTPVTSSMGNCNSCHSPFGSGNPTPPGRILAP